MVREEELMPSLYFSLHKLILHYLLKQSMNCEKNIHLLVIAHKIT